MVTNPNYSAKNLVAFNFAGFACVAFVVFLTSTQPFFLSDVIGVDSARLGSVIGTLGALDELTSIISAPFIGTLSDKLSVWASTRETLRAPSGPRVILFCSFLILGASLLGYGMFSEHIGDLYLWRPLFAIGVTGCMSMVTVLLNELSNSDFRFEKLAFWRKERNQLLIRDSETLETDYSSRSELERNESSYESTERGSVAVGEEVLATASKKNGKYAALIGVSTGLGAVFAVSVFLPLPLRLTSLYPDLSSEEGLQMAYVLLGIYSVGVAFVVFSFLYDSVKEKKILRSRNDAETQPGYFRLLRLGISLSKSDHRVQLAYVGAFVARSSTVANAVFLPLLAYTFYRRSGECTGLSKATCSEAYIFAAILTGVAQTVALISAPAWGWLIDKGKYRALFISGLFGATGAFGLSSAGLFSDVYDPRNWWCFTMASFMGIAQVGSVISSMSVLSGLIYMQETLVIGSLSGLYSLSGGVGILVLSKVGGSWADDWIMAPFCLLGVFHVVLASAAVRCMRR